MRFAYKLKSRFQRLRERGFISPEELAQRLRVSATTIHQWGHAGWLARQRYGNHQFLYEPVKSGTIHKGQGGRQPRGPSFTVPRSR